MTITDFYKKDKICMSKWTTCLLEPLAIAVKVEDGDKQEEMLFKIPVGFCTDTYFNKNDFGTKSDEANILFSYLIRNERQVTEEFGMNERRFHVMLAKLEVVLIRNYAICNWFKKTWKLMWAYVGLFEGFLLGD